jgi:hypothetical protein
MGQRSDREVAALTADQASRRTSGHRSPLDHALKACLRSRATGGQPRPGAIIPVGLVSVRAAVAWSWL